MESALRNDVTKPIGELQDTHPAHRGEHHTAFAHRSPLCAKRSHEARQLYAKNFFANTGYQQVALETLGAALREETARELTTANQLLQAAQASH